MMDYLEHFEDEELDLQFSPEDEESVEKALRLTREIFRNPRRNGSGDAHSALVIWEHAFLYISDSILADSIGEVIDLLEEIGSRRRLSSEDIEHGLRALRAISEALRGRNGHRLINETGEGGLESDG